MVNVVQTWRGAVEPAETSPSGNEHQGWRGAVEPAGAVAEEEGGINIRVVRAIIRECIIDIVYDPQAGLYGGSIGGDPPSPDITTAGGGMRDGETFTIFVSTGGLTGVTNVAINSINCTGESVTNDTTMVATGPVDDLLHGTSYTLAFTGGSASNISSVFFNPEALPSLWSWIAWDGLTIPPDSIFMHDDGQDDTSTAAAFLTDSTAAFPTDNSWDTGFIVRNTSDGSEGPITATTATTITATLAGGTNNNWDSGDFYEVIVALETSDQCVFDTITDNSGTVEMTVKGVPSITGPSGTHNFDYKFRDLTDSKVSATYTATVTV